MLLQIGKVVRQQYSEWVDQHVPDDKYATVEIDAQTGYCHELGVFHSKKRELIMLLHLLLCIPWPCFQA